MIDVQNKAFLELGLYPTKLSESLLLEIKEVADKYSHRCDLSKMFCESFWTNNEQRNSMNFFKNN